jgi:hypothetical protein
MKAKGEKGGCGKGEGGGGGTFPGREVDRPRLAAVEMTFLNEEKVGSMAGGLVECCSDLLLPNVNELDRSSASPSSPRAS